MADASTFKESLTPLHLLTEIIQNRRTCKNFDGQKIPKSEIEFLLKNAVWAPNHRLNEPWRFKVCYGDGLQKFSQFLKSRLSSDEVKTQQKGFDLIEKAGALLMVSSEKNADPFIELENYAATCCAIQNILLTAQTLKIASYWSTGKFVSQSVSLEFFGIRETEKLIGGIWLGRSESAQTSKRTSADKKTIWID